MRPKAATSREVARRGGAPSTDLRINPKLYSLDRFMHALQLIRFEEAARLPGGADTKYPGNCRFCRVGRAIVAPENAELPAN